MFTTVGPYRIEGELARGGAGVVYLARDPDGGEAVVKLLLGGTHAHEKALKRFEREGEVLARLDHPHVVKINPPAQRPRTGLINQAGPAPTTVCMVRQSDLQPLSQYPGYTSTVRTYCCRLNTN